MKQRDVAAAMGDGFDASGISNIEMDRRGTSVASLKRIAVCLNVSTDYLFGLTDNPASRHADEETFVTDDKRLAAVLGTLSAHWDALNEYGRRTFEIELRKHFPALRWAEPPNRAAADRPAPSAGRVG